MRGKPKNSLNVFLCTKIENVFTRGEETEWAVKLIPGRLCFCALYSSQYYSQLRPERCRCLPGNTTSAAPLAILQLLASMKPATDFARQASACRKKSAEHLKNHLTFWTTFQFV